ncbi:amino acid ABC transporter permease [Mesorhizobium sp. Cs1299R1N3]|uniref:amino acid ABC transporter permease n=1 Tax=Mesorhizobium sp. Cs1299R1N3 TaxID=3015173 RepID=UPI00301D415C
MSNTHQPLALNSSALKELVTSDKIVPVRHYGRLVGSILAILVVAQFALAFATSPYIDWSVIGHFLTNVAVLEGLKVTLELTVIAMCTSLVVSIAIATMRMSRSGILRGIAYGYVFVFRGVPLLVILIVTGNLGLFYKNFTVGIPLTGIVFYSTPMQAMITPFVASVIGLTLSASAYMSEIVRGGLLAVDRGQFSASKALGLNSLQTFRYVVLPQAMRVITPPLGNEFINVLKATSLVSVIAGGDLLTITQAIAGTNYKVIELMIVATLWYLAVIITFSIFQYFLERKIAAR